MPKKKVQRSQEEKEKLAARIVASSDGEISIPAAMKTAGINTPSTKNNTIYKRVHRESKRVEKLLAQMEADDSSTNSTPKPRTVAAQREASDFLSLSESTNLTTTTGVASTPLSGIRRMILDKETVATTTTDTPVKRRQTSKPRHNEDSEKRKKQRKETEATKLATIKVQENEILDPKDKNRVSTAEIVRQVNSALGTMLSHKTVRRMYREGQINSSPMKRGPAGSFSKGVWKAMYGAFTTYIQLEQAAYKKQSMLNQLAQKVNLMVNKAGHKKT